MPSPHLSGLIDRNIVARETYLLRRRQQASLDRRLSSVLVRQARTDMAELEWEEAEKALWRFRALQIETGMDCRHS